MIIFLIFLLLLPVSPVFAANEFSVSQDITYTINTSGTAFIRQEISLTNNYSQIYAEKYQVRLSGSNITNIRASDKNGDIPKEINNSADNTIITLKFSSPAVGKDQKNNFYLEYNIPSFAIKKGNTWEIQFPVFSSAADNQQLNLNLIVPKEFGELSFSSIPVNNQHLLNDTIQIQFNQKQVVDNKILLIFGNHQLFDFQLDYHLSNPTDSTVSTEIPLPPDTNNQTIIIKKIDPPPLNITADPDGNWLAQYHLNAAQSIVITATGQAKIHPPGNLESLNDKNALLQPQPYWPTDNPQLIAIANNLSTPKQIYRYVVDHLNYDYSRIDSAGRRGALQAITSPNQSLCTEFTDLFVTLCRIRGIPAREIEGYAFSNNLKIKPTNPSSDILHAWPEYYDSDRQSWFQVDPTWEKTTNGIDYFTDLDLNHLAFVIHGISSDYPSAPGSYKNNPNLKTVFVDFAATDLNSEFISPELSISGNTLTIRNPNMTSLRPLSLTLSGYDWSPELALIPPYGSVSLNLPSNNILFSFLPSAKYYHFQLAFSESDNPVTYQLLNRYHFLCLGLIIAFIIILLSLGGIIITTSHKKS